MDSGFMALPGKGSPHKQSCGDQKILMYALAHATCTFILLYFSHRRLEASV